ncbi:tail fiber protein [Patulibacter sp. SYSU D01012]|uniref:phage tail protein n=1 Tax=Patulibacter sp. SYSU D01012 TaxID=2817381 RepID=UPI001B313398|nr:tail fiber protein [Patulibacter sp. SYSU D01012]
MSEAFIAEIRMFGGNFAPRGWAFCQGQIMSIAQNTALFSLLGTTYGGNGQTTFGLPDLRGRTPIGTGQGPGLPATNLGEISGSPTHTLIITEMPAHNHTFQNAGTTVDLPATNGRATTSRPEGGIPAAGGSYAPLASAGGTKTRVNASVSGTVGIAGGSQPFSIMQPYLGMNYIIAVEGIYPSRD